MRIVHRVGMAAAVVAGAWASSAQAIEVDQWVWGFDGTVIEQRFNVLSVLVVNNTPEPFEGTLKLTKTYGAGAVDAPILEPVFVSPFTSRWVQFYPYVNADYERWILSWGKSSRDRIDFPETRVGAKARILLTPPDNLVERGVGLKRLPANLFPPFSTATDGLAMAVLDHVPRWEAARRQAFLEWLQRGGTLHLLLDSNAHRLEFPADLAELNAPLEEFRVGSGRVYRHNARRSEVTAAALEEREARTRGQEDEPLTAGDAAQAEEEDEEEQLYYYNSWMNDLAASLFTNLKEMTKPDHSWGVIYLMAMAYIAAIFPGFYILGRKKLDYRVVYAAFIGVVALFSLGFAWVGRRGYGESTTCNSVAIAKGLPSGAWDVSLWSNAFVRDGAWYRLTHKASGTLYSTAQVNEAVNGEIRNGAGAELYADIPPFSSRTFAGRMKIDGEPLELARAAGDAPGGGLRIRGKFPPKASVIRVMALADGQMRPAYMAEEGVIQVNSGGPKLVDWMTQLLSNNSYGMYSNPWARGDESPDVRYAAMVEPLVARSLDLKKKKDAKQFSLPPGCVRLFLYANMPESFFIDNPDLGHQNGRVLYCIDFYPNEPAR